MDSKSKPLKTDSKLSNNAEQVVTRVAASRKHKVAAGLRKLAFNS